MPTGRLVRGDRVPASAWVPRPWSAWLAFGCCVAAALVVALVRPGRDALSDLDVYVGAARSWLAGGSLYAFTAANGDAFVYPPAAGLAVVPVALLPDAAAGVLWTLLQAAEVLVLARVVVRRSPLPVLARLPRAAAVPTVAVVLLLSYPVLSGVFLGQVSLLVTLLALLDAVDVVPRRWQGVLTGLAAAVKLTPLVFVPYLWLTGRRRAALTALAVFTLAGAAAWWVRPADSLRYWASASTPRPYIDLGQADNASLVALLARTGWTGATATAVLLLVGVLVVLYGYARALEAHRRGQVLAGAVVVGAVVVLVSPVSWSHHQVLLVLAAACTVGGSPGRSRAWTLGVLVLTSAATQTVLVHWWSPGPLLGESTVLLALAIACLVPFGPPGDRRRSPRASDHEPAWSPADAGT